MTTMRNPSENTDRPLSDSELAAVCGGIATETRGSVIGETTSNKETNLGTAGCMRSGMIETTSNAGYCSRFESF